MIFPVKVDNVTYLQFYKVNVYAREDLVAASEVRNFSLVAGTDSVRCTLRFFPSKKFILRQCDESGPFLFARDRFFRFHVLPDGYSQKAGTLWMNVVMNIRYYLWVFVIACA